MNKYEYPSIICNYCRYTNYGFEEVGTSPFNLCEGMGCENAYVKYVEETGDNSSLEDLF